MTANGGKRIQSNAQNTTETAAKKADTGQKADASKNKIPEDDKHTEGTKLGHYVIGKGS